ncbi:cholecystokinin receptor-like, partial [Rhincodon typus]|uniref:cholecystokinin receptor-like n=1 Tax=Rhincodon typus TaxID=259920 RepID=UPI002030481F
MDRNRSLWPQLQCLNGSESGILNGSCGETGTGRAALTGRKDLDYTVRILLYSIIFLLSVFGNTMIILVLILNKRLQTVTNSFLLSLALSDLMVALFCMPFTLIPNLLGDFIFGQAMCKITAYFM